MIPGNTCSICEAGQRFVPQARGVAENSPDEELRALIDDQIDAFEGMIEACLDGDFAEAGDQAGLFSDRLFVAEARLDELLQAAES